MKMLKKTALTALFAFAVTAPALAEEGGTRIAVVPFAALSGDVPQRAGSKAAGMLSNELKNADGFALVELKPKAGGDDPYSDQLEAARAAVTEAEALRAKRKFRAAEEALQKALGSYEQASAALTDVGELQDAWVLLSAIQYNTGRDDEGARSLATALALAPARELPLAKSSPLFTRVVNEAKEKLAKGPKGTLLVESSPPRAAVTVDGVAVGNSPVVLTDVPPGPHLWRVQLPSGEVIGGLAQVAAQKQTKATAQSTGTDPESKMIAGLSTNRVDKDVVEAARQQAKTVEAEMLIFGALSRSGKNLVLDSFLVKASSGEVKRLPRSTFDAELLSAGMEFYNLVGRLSKEGLKVGSDTMVPGAVAVDVKTSGLPVTEVRYGQSTQKGGDALGESAGDARSDQKRTPLDPKRKRVPLKAGGR